MGSGFLLVSGGQYQRQQCHNNENKSSISNKTAGRTAATTETSTEGGSLSVLPQIPSWGGRPPCGILDRLHQLPGLAGGCPFPFRHCQRPQGPHHAAGESPTSHSNTCPEPPKADGALLPYDSCHSANPRTLSELSRGPGTASFFRTVSLGDGLDQSQ